MKTFKKILYLLFCFMFIWAIPLYLGIFLQDSAGAGLVCLFSVIFVLAINASRIRSFKLLGLEAELKETIQEANATIEQLRDIATSVSKTAISTMMSDNFLGGMTLRQRMDLQEEVIVSLKKLSLSDEEMSDVLGFWNKGLDLLYNRKISNKIFADKNGNEWAPRREEYKEMGNFKEWRAPTVEAIEAFIGKYQIELEPEVRDLIEDYRYHQNVRKLRNKEALLNGQ